MEHKNYLPVALGTWSWGVGGAGGDEVFGNHLGREQLKAVFDRATERGLTLFDTATVYGMGASEDILGAFVKEYPRANLYISTKFTPQIAGGGANPVEDMCNASLRRLHTDYIDIYWIHNPADVERWTPMLVPLVKSGKVRSVGVSNHNLRELERAEEILSSEGVHISAVQNHYSLLYRSSERGGILDYCRAHGITFFSYMVLEQGALSGRYGVNNPLPAGSDRGNTYNRLLPEIEKLTAYLKQLGAEYGASAAQIAESWAMAKGTVPIIGVTRPSQVDDAAGAAKISLTQSQIATMEQLANDAAVDTRGSWEHPMD